MNIIISSIQIIYTYCYYYYLNRNVKKNNRKREKESKVNFQSIINSIFIHSVFILTCQ